MATISKRSWLNDARRIEDPALFREVLRTPNMSPGKLSEYLDALAARGLSLPYLSAMARHSFIFLEGTPHLELRRRVAPIFAASAIEEWRPKVIEAIETALQGLRSTAEPDLVRDFAEPAFLSVIKAFSGLEGKAPDALLQWVITANDATEPLLSVSELRKIDAAMAEIAACLAHSTRPPGSLMALLEPTAPAIDPLGSSVSIAISALIAAVTMLQSLSFALNGLLLRPQADWARVADPAQRGPVLEEVLSLYLSTLLLGRVAEKDIEIGGCPFHKDQTVLLDIRRANETLRHEKGPQAHLSFGSGHHKCVGEHLARLFLAEALPRLANAFPRLTLHRDKITHNRTSIVQSPRALPCLLAPANQQVNSRMREMRSEAEARAILNDDAGFMPPPMVPHLERLQAATGHDLGAAIRFARNAPFFLSGPRHAELRRCVFAQLGGNRLKEWEPLWASVIAQALDGLADNPMPDLIADFADPVFKQSVKPVFGIVSQDPARFDRLAPRIQTVLNPLLPLRELIAVQGDMKELLSLLPETARPSQTAQPADASGPEARGLLNALLSLPPDGFDTTDIKSLVLVLYGASFNLRHTLGNVLHHLLSLPREQRDEIIAAPDRAARFDRLIALCASPRYIYRAARNDHPALGITQGTTLRFHIPSLNREAPVGHLAFGHGLHRCFGAALSRQIILTAVPALLARFPDLGLDPQRHRYFEMPQTIALETLPCFLSTP